MRGRAERAQARGRPHLENSRASLTSLAGVVLHNLPIDSDPQVIDIYIVPVPERLQNIGKRLTMIPTLKEEPCQKLQEVPRGGPWRGCKGARPGSPGINSILKVVHQDNTLTFKACHYDHPPTVSAIGRRE